MSRKILGQVVPSATTLTDVTTAVVPANKMYGISNIQACNQGTATALIRISVCDKDDADNVKQYLAYDWPLGAKDSFYLTAPLWLPTDWEVRCYSSLADVSFQCWGQERAVAIQPSVAQLSPSAASLTTLLTVTDTKETVVGLLTACNRATSSDLVRIAVQPDGATIDPKHYLYYDFVLPGNDMLEITSGLALGDGDVVSVYSLGGNVSFNAFYMEVGE